MPPANKRIAAVKPERARVGRPPRIDRAREHILEIAAEVISAKGFDAASMEEISTAVGASKAALYHYFDSKAALYDDLIVGTLSEMLHNVNSAVALETSAPARMRAYITAHINYMEKRFAAVSTIVHSASMRNRRCTPQEPELRRAFEDLIGQIIRDGIKDGSFRDVDVALTQKAVLGMLAWTPKWRPAAGKVKAAQIIAAYVDLVLSGLESNPAA